MLMHAEAGYGDVLVDFGVVFGKGEWGEIFVPADSNINFGLD
jgi:hypothetical protein